MYLNEHCQEEDIDIRVVDEIILDEDGDEVEYAEFTVEDLERERLAIQAELNLLKNEADSDPDTNEAAKDR